MHDLAERLLKTIRKQELIRAGDRLGVAVSGGADSVGLLLLLVELRAELGIGLSVVHINHKLRGQESDEDERFVAELARQQGVAPAVSMLYGAFSGIFAARGMRLWILALRRDSNDRADVAPSIASRG